MKKTIFLIALVILGVSQCYLRSKSALTKTSELKPLMGTFVSIDVCHQDKKSEHLEKTFDIVWRRLDDLIWRMNVYESKSEVNQINNSFDKLVEVSPETYYVLKESLNYYKLTDGAFDITVRSIIDLWKKAEEVNKAPQADGLKFILDQQGSDLLELNKNNQVKNLGKFNKIDLGAIAKGYMVDRAAEIFKESGYDNFYIDAGGDVYASGKNCIGQKWSIGIRNPAKFDEILHVVKISDKAVTTSGNYEQYFEIEGQRYSHIIDPRTGYPQQGVVSATVIADTAMQADALSTAMTVLGAPEGIQLIDIKTSSAALIIHESNNGSFKEFESRNYHKFRLK